MTTSSTNLYSLLSIDIGSVNTRATFFDVIDSRYRFIANGSATSTVDAPINDASEGVNVALERLQSVMGRILVGPDGDLIIPSMHSGDGVDSVVVTLSAGPPLKVVVVGLLEDVSLKSAQRLARSIYSHLVGKISLNDNYRSENRIDAILHLRPDLIIAAGGTDEGAEKSVLGLLESIGLANYLMTDSHRPEVLFTGNKLLAERVKSSFGRSTSLRVAPNIHPSLDEERLDPARVQLADLYRNIKGQQIAGINDLNILAGDNLLPTSMAFARMIRFLSKIYDSNKGVLGVDVGASATTIAAANSGEMSMGVYPGYGIGEGIVDLLKQSGPSEIIRWLPFDLSEKSLQEYAYTKKLYPKSIPVTEKELAIEQAFARQALRISVKRMVGQFPEKNNRSNNSGLPLFEPIVASGSVMTKVSSFAQAALMVLDGLQPSGVTTLVLDQNHISSALGAAAAVNPLLVVQVLESSTFLNLGTVIAPSGEEKPGTTILHVRMERSGGGETKLDVKQGDLELIPLPTGQSAQLHLQPLHKYEVGMGGKGRGGSVKVTGSALGVIIDARGRPLNLPDDPDQRKEKIKKWQWILGS